VAPDLQRLRRGTWQTFCLLQYYDPSKEPPYFDKNLDYGNKHGQLVWLSTIERFIKLLQYIKDVFTLSLRESTLLFN
jgi:hypothetical protein